MLPSGTIEDMGLSALATFSQTNGKDVGRADAGAASHTPQDLRKVAPVSVTPVLILRAMEPRKAGMGDGTEELTLGSLPQAHCMCDSALRGLGSGVFTSSSESLLGDVSPSDERLQETRIQRHPHQPATRRPRPPPPNPPARAWGKYLQNIFMLVLHPQNI